MKRVSAESGSYRDPGGRIFYADDRVLRTVMPNAMDDFDFVRSTGLIRSLVNDGKVVAETKVEKDILGDIGKEASLVLEHPRIPFVSYPYEWSFSALKAAALLQLDILRAALKTGVTLADASAYNIQFLGPNPIFIDSLSFRRYKEGEFWGAHRQFCEQYVNPLLLQAITGIAHNSWYRGSLEGISVEDLNSVLPWRSRLSWNVFTNVYLQARLQNSSAGAGAAIEKAKANTLPRIGFEQMLHSLQRWITKLQPKSSSKTVWQDYAIDNSYSDAEMSSKRQFIADFARKVSPPVLLDIGCNTGDYSAVALENGADLAIGLDFDNGALEIAFQRAQRESLNFLPLHLDATNPSPNQGWMQSERMGFQDRAKGDAVLSLALIHHLAIAKNVPLDQVVDWLLNMAPQGIVEFVPKADPMVQRLLELREDIFDDYEKTSFEKLLSDRARIVNTLEVSSSGRTLYWFERT